MLYFQSGAGGNWFRYTASCLVHGDFEFIPNNRQKDSYHTDLVYPYVLIMDTHHWSFGDLNTRLLNNKRPIIIYEPRYFWNLYQNWLVKYELFYNESKYKDEKQAFTNGVEIFKMLARWKKIENVPNVSYITYNDMYENINKFLQSSYYELERIGLQFERNDDMFLKKISEYKSKNPKYDKFIDTDFWYGFVSGYVQHNNLSSVSPRTFYDFKDYITFFKKEVYPMYREDFIKEHVLKV